LGGWGCERGVKQMTGRERVNAALDFEPVDRVPLEVDEGTFPEFESDVAGAWYRYGPGKTSGVPYKRGARTDMWGNVMEAGEDGVKGEVKHPLLDDWSKLDGLYVPYDALEQADLSRLEEQHETTGKFIVRAWGIEPFQMMQYLRGSENLYLDLALEDEHVMRLRDVVHAFYKTEVQLWAETCVDAIHLEDDWGAQKAMLVSPKMWRALFKPLYKEYCDIAHSHGKRVLMHSDGYILDIVGDLAEIGVESLNPQLGVMGDDRLAEAMRGKIALWGGIDRQWILPFGTEADAARQVRETAARFFVNGASGVIGHSFRDKDAKVENVRAVYREWARYGADGRLR